MRKTICLLFALLVSATAMAQSTIIFVRHAEKSVPDGDHPLSEQGHARAARLASMLRDAGVDHIYTSQMIRTKETAEPLAKALGIAGEVVPAADLDALVAKLKSLPKGSVALVAGHSNTIPKIIEKLGGAIPAIDDSEYDRMIIVTRFDTGATVVTIRY